MRSILQKNPSPAAQVLYQNKTENKSHLIDILSSIDKHCGAQDIRTFLELIKKVQNAVNAGNSFADVANKFFSEFQENRALDISHINHKFTEIISSIKKESFLLETGMEQAYSQISYQVEIKKDLFLCLFLATQRSKIIVKGINLFNYVNCTKTIEDILTRIQSHYSFDKKIPFSESLLPKAHYTGHLDKDKKPTGDGLFYNRHSDEKVIIQSDAWKIYQDEHCEIKIGHTTDEYIIKHKDLTYHFVFEKTEETSFSTYMSTDDFDHKTKKFQGILTVSSPLFDTEKYIQRGIFESQQAILYKYAFFKLKKGTLEDFQGNIWEENKPSHARNIYDALSTPQNSWTIQTAKGILIEAKSDSCKKERIELSWLSIQDHFLCYFDYFKIIYPNGNYATLKYLGKNSCKIEYFLSSTKDSVCTYEGEYDSNDYTPHGFGTFSHQDGTKIFGRWEHGSLKPQRTKIIFPDGQTVSGIFEFQLNSDNFFDLTLSKPKLIEDQPYIKWDQTNGIILQKQSDGKIIKFKYAHEDFKYSYSSYFSNYSSTHSSNFKGKCFLPIEEYDDKTGFGIQETEYIIDAEWMIRNAHPSNIFIELMRYEYFCTITYYSSDRVEQRKYQGPLDENSKPHGNGKVSYSDGIEITGNWKNGLFFEQQAVVTYPDNTSIEGYFYLDESQRPILNKSKRYAIKTDKEMVIFWTKSDGSKRKLQYNLTHPYQGILSIYDASSDDYGDQDLRSKYTGFFDEDLEPHDQGTLEYPNQTTFSGFWKHGQLSDHANRLIDSDGIIHEGEFTLDRDMRPLLNQEKKHLIWNKQEGTIVLNSGQNKRTLHYNAQTLDENSNYQGELSYVHPDLSEDKTDQTITTKIDGIWKINDKVGNVSFELVKIKSYVPETIVFEVIQEKMGAFQLNEVQPVLTVLPQDDIILFVSKHLSKDLSPSSLSSLRPEIVSKIIEIFTPSRLSSFEARMQKLLPQDVCSAFLSNEKIRDGLVSFLTRIKTDCHPLKSQRTRDFMQLAWTSFLEFIYFLYQDESVIPFKNKEIALLKFIDITLACDESIPVRINEICVSLKNGTSFCDPYRFQRNLIVESFVPKFLNLCAKNGHPIWDGMHIHVLPFLANHVARAFNFETDHQSEKDPYAQQAWGEENGQPVPTSLYETLCALDSDKMSEDLLHPANQAFAQHRKENNVESTIDSVLNDLYQKLSPYLGRPLLWSDVKKINEDILEERLKNLCGSTETAPESERSLFDDRAEYFQANEDETEFWLNPQLLIDLPYFVTVHLKDLGYLKP